MCVCVYACMSVYCMSVSTYSINVCVSVSVFTCFVCVFVCAYVYVYVCASLVIVHVQCEHSLQGVCCSPLQHASSDVERLLVGNKCDLETQRAIPYQRGEQVSSTSRDLVGYHGTNTDGKITEH